MCAVREWTTPAELADWLGLSRRNLTGRHLGPMTDQGLLERRYPNRKRHRDQAYRTPPPAIGSNSLLTGAPADRVIIGVSHGRIE